MRPTARTITRTRHAPSRHEFSFFRTIFSKNHLDRLESTDAYLTRAFKSRIANQKSRGNISLQGIEVTLRGSKIVIVAVKVKLVFARG
ncbi:MAG: hypothetical protein JWN73_4862 [Betaproteobacteria bacterium]|nr:hypothetical protein [Betaproteobacteria bacterium]